MLVTTFWGPRRGWAALSLVALVAGMTGLAAVPASAADATPMITNPTAGFQMWTLPSVAGTGEPGASVVVTDDTGTQMCASVVDEFGNFSCSGTQFLATGNRTLTVTATNGDGATVAGNSVTIEAFKLPLIEGPGNGALIPQSESFNGTAVRGEEVQLRTPGGEVVCSAVAEEGFGQFNCTPEKPLSPGPLTLVPVQIDSAGAETVGDAGNWTVSVAPTITSPKSGDVVGDLPVFTGTGYPGADIDIVHGQSGSSLCSAKVATNGTFSCPMTRRLTVGTVDVFPALGWGTTSAVAGTMITVAVEVTPKIIRPADRGIISASPVIEGTAGVFTLIAILDEQGETVCTTKTDLNGNFGCVAGFALSPGYHSLTPVQTSFAGVAVNGASVRVTVPGNLPGTASPASPPATHSPTPTTAAAVVVQGTESGGLANTGANSVAVAGIASGGLLLAGVGALLMLRRRTRMH